MEAIRVAAPKSLAIREGESKGRSEGDVRRFYSVAHKSFGRVIEIVAVRSWKSTLGDKEILEGGRTDEDQGNRMLKNAYNRASKKGKICSLEAYPRRVPITDGKLNMGTWQGIWLCEHRDHPTARKVVVTLNGI
ncbi:hypothetical protein D5086_004009 [Populus alba]|uniref:Uncharacterized protein n=1 Tax=Populus alba TaxID=43335 RepID=A0ACC4CPB5_POPAL